MVIHKLKDSEQDDITADKAVVCQGVQVKIGGGGSGGGRGEERRIPASVTARPAGRQCRATLLLGPGAVFT